ncbi:hypothetical protein FGO68_gene6834 [Halteria grandinella]|uniref:Uncharacterized protein n=1 Tax=Halteria grandinella TaxID=5974 RepID=A0A8J8P4H1_HALGN|nr:hypothetical protein FGO68_gene6834 [Halteria grandinella]
MDMLIILLLTLMSRSNAYNCFTLPYPQLFASTTAQSIPLSTDYIKGQSLDVDSVGNIVYGIETTDPAVHWYTSGIMYPVIIFMDTWGLKKWAKSYGLGDQYIKKVTFNPQGTKIAALASYNGLGSGERAETFIYTMEASGGSAINQFFIAINNYEATDYNVRDTMLYDSMGNIIVGFFSKFNPPNWLQRYKLIKFTDSLTPSIVWRRENSAATNSQIHSMAFGQTEADLYISTFFAPIERVILYVDATTGLEQWALKFSSDMCTLYQTRYKTSGTDRVLVVSITYDNTNPNKYNGLIRILLDSSNNPLSYNIWYDTGSNFKLSRALTIINKDLIYQVYVDVPSKILYFAEISYASSPPQLKIIPILSGGGTSFEFRLGVFTSGNIFYIPGYLNQIVTPVVTQTFAQSTSIIFTNDQTKTFFTSLQLFLLLLP